MRMDETAKTRALEKIAQTGYVSPELMDMGIVAGDVLGNKIRKALPKEETLEDVAKRWSTPDDKTLEALAKETGDSVEKMKSRLESDPYYYNILVGGANAGGKGWKGWSALPFGVLAKGRNRKLFRNGDIDGIRKEIEWAVENGLHPRVFGHSWGGSDVARMAKDYPEVPFYALDPVSWTGRIDRIPKNLTICRPKQPEVYNGLGNKLAPIFGGRWPNIIKGEGRTVEYEGNHTWGLEGVIKGINEEERGKRESRPRPFADSSYEETLRKIRVPFGRHLNEWKKGL